MIDMDPEKHADGFTPFWGYVVSFDKYAAQAARIEQLEAAVRTANLETIAALDSADIAADAIRHKAREDALREAAKKASVVMRDYAADKGSTKTPGGRTVLFYGRKASEAILALIKKDYTT